MLSANGSFPFRQCQFIRYHILSKYMSCFPPTDKNAKQLFKAESAVNVKISNFSFSVLK